MQACSTHCHCTNRTDLCAGYGGREDGFSEKVLGPGRIYNSDLCFVFQDNWLGWGGVECYLWG